MAKRLGRRHHDIPPSPPPARPLTALTCSVYTYHPGTRYAYCTTCLPSHSGYADKKLRKTDECGAYKQDTTACPPPPPFVAALFRVVCTLINPIIAKPPLTSPLTCCTLTICSRKPENMATGLEAGHHDPPPPP